MIADDHRAFYAITPLATPSVLVDRAQMVGDAVVQLKASAWASTSAAERDALARQVVFQRWRCNPSGRLAFRIEPKRRLMRALMAELRDDAVAVLALLVAVPVVLCYLAARRVGGEWER